MTDTLLPGIKLVLGLTGGVAAYKAAELARLLMHAGADVQAVMTRSASKFVGTATLQALTGKPVLTELWDEAFPNSMAHIDLSRAADAILVAPASADFIAKLAHGLADDLLSDSVPCTRLPAPGCTGDEQANVGKRRNSTQYRYTEARRRDNTWAR